MFAAGEGHAGCVRALLSAGAKLDSANNEGDTALLLSCHAGHAPCVRLLLDARARVDAARATGYTA